MRQDNKARLEKLREEMKTMERKPAPKPASKKEEKKEEKAKNAE